jgi:hypothetical protein
MILKDDIMLVQRHIFEMPRSKSGLIMSAEGYEHKASKTLEVTSMPMFVKVLITGPDVTLKPGTIIQTGMVSPTWYKFLPIPGYPENTFGLVREAETLVVFGTEEEFNKTMESWGGML